MHRAIPIPLLALTLLAAGCGGSSNESGAASTTATTEPTTTSVAAAAADGCTGIKVPVARAGGGATAPKERLDQKRSYRLAFRTNCGTFTVTLDLRTAPATAASLVSLARSGFYDSTVFHRIVPGFVIQGGDPTQSGRGGPGYKTVDPPPADSTYPEGVVAMAKTSSEPAGTAGSQFFVVSGPSAATLPPEYAIVGTVTRGMATVRRIDGFGDRNDPAGRPTRPVVVESVRVEER